MLISTLLAVLSVAVFDRGGVTFDFAEISARRYANGAKFSERSGWPISITNRPFGYLDNRFAVSRGQCGIVSFGWRRDGKYPLAVKTEDFKFRIDVQCGYRVVGTTFGDAASRVCEPMPGGATRVSCNIRRGFVPSTWMNNQATCNILVEATNDAREGMLTLVVTAPDGKPISNPASVILYAVAPIRARAVPKRYRNGIDAAQHLFFFEDAAYDKVAKLLAEIGAGWLVQDIRNMPFVPFWRKHVDGPITPMWDKVIENGFRVGQPGKVPTSDRLVCDESSKRVNRRPGRKQYLTESTCPMSVYCESDYFRNVTMAELSRMLKGCDGLWGNWEPSMFFMNGCWCDRCREEFVKWSKLPAEEVRTKWPKALEEDGEWKKLGLKFASWQHAKVVRTIDKYVKAATGGDKSLGFIPGVSALEMCDYWRRTGYPEGALQVEYAGDMRWMNAWGPYVRWESDKPFAYERRSGLIHWVYAVDVPKTLPLDHPDGRLPKLLAYPQGTQCGTWVTQPEQIGLALDSFLLNKWDSACVYYFPNGCDARYLKTYAAANERAAVAEDFVLDGRPADAKVKATAVPEYAIPVRKVMSWLPAYTNMALLQTKAFDLNGSRLVAVLNFWDAGAAFFELKCSGLQKGDYSVIAGDTAWVKDREHPYWTADELDGGVRMAVGALRSSFFVIRPRASFKPKGVRHLITRDDVERLYGEMRGQLREVAERDAKVERSLPDPKPDWWGIN